MTYEQRKDGIMELAKSLTAEEVICVIGGLESLVYDLADAREVEKVHVESVIVIICE